MRREESEAARGFLTGVRVLEVADELGEYCGKVLAGLGADVIKVEPPGGDKTRSYGPFYGDEPDPDRSLYFWHYNFGKRGIILDLESKPDQGKFRELVQQADVILETRRRGYMDDRGLGYEALAALNPRIIMARISPFGDSGPWADYCASDLIHLALGGVMMNCGYDPEPSGFYETPPIAPQMWQAYHIVGEMAAIGIMGALYYRHHSGRGQHLSTTVHDAVAKQTESDLPDWVYSREPHYRHTCRHSFANPPPTIAMTKDGRWILPYQTYLGSAHEGGWFERMVALLDRYGMADDLKDADVTHRSQPSMHVTDVVARFVSRFLFSREIWREGQAAGLTWAPVIRPEENLQDAHWRQRETFLEVEHPELMKTFTYVGAKWMAPEVPWRKGPRAPLLGEHNEEVLGTLKKETAQIVPAPIGAPETVLSKHGKPWAMNGVRIIDLSWLLASGGAGRYLASLGAEVIKIEHKSRPDGIRWGRGMVPPGGRFQRNRATEPILGARPANPNRSGFFMEINAGKRSISLNLKHPLGKELFARLVKLANVVAEGFSAGTMDRMGFGYERLKEINPSIVYAQQSGMGQIGIYGQMRSYGPVAQAFSGLSEMSGLAEPYPPAGIGYSYLDWFGAYNLATAMMAGVYRQRLTGRGCWIDSSQVETGIYISGTAILDYTTRGRRWQRYGNRSPYKAASPHGAYRARGQDRWIAIACFTEDQWRDFLGVVGNPEWGRQPRFATLELRMEHQDDLDALVTTVTEGREPYELMDQLQRAGVPAGVCQTAEDRYECDPQLKHLQWMVELTQSEIGTWPVKEFPVRLSETPAYMGGVVDRSGPNYGEDNEYVYGEILGFSTREIRELEDQEVI